MFFIFMCFLNHFMFSNHITKNMYINSVSTFTEAHVTIFSLVVMFFDLVVMFIYI